MTTVGTSLWYLATGPSTLCSSCVDPNELVGPHLAHGRVHSRAYWYGTMRPVRLPPHNHRLLLACSLLTSLQVNIYSHAIGSALFALLPAHFYFIMYSQVKGSQPIDLFLFTVYFLGVSVCFACSATYDLQSHRGGDLKLIYCTAATCFTITVRQLQIWASIWTCAAL